MLAEAIDAQRGTTPATKTERALPSISLQVDAYIPSDFVEDMNQRLRLYQRLAGAGTVDDLNDLAAELRDRFGPLPDAVLAMLATVRIRIKADLLGISSITIDPTSLIIRGNPLTPFDRAALYGRFGMAARVDRGILRVPALRLSSARVNDVEDILDRAIALAHLGSDGPTPTQAREDERRPVAARRGFPT
jgi:transcription-repair coupling factor (superfamily II helicase)